MLGAASNRCSNVVERGERNERLGNRKTWGRANGIMALDEGKRRGGSTALILHYLLLHPRGPNVSWLLV